MLEAFDLGRRPPGTPFWLLRNVSLQLPPATSLAIVGPSGGGKTLLLRAVALLDPLDAGQIRWQGGALADADVPAYRSRVIYVQQRPALLAGRVEANLRQPYLLAIHRRRQFDRSRVLDLLDHLGRETSFLDKSHRDLSGGESQIVALVRAIQLDPDVLLLDEPTSAMDRQTSAAAERLIGQWQLDGAGQRSFLWVTHDIEQAERMGDRVIEMRAGQLVGDR